MWKKTSNASIIRSTSIDNKTLLHQRVSISTKIIFDLFDFGVNVSCSKRLRSSDSGKFNYCMQYSTSVWHRVSTISFSNVNPFLANAVITYPQKILQSFFFCVFREYKTNFSGPYFLVFGLNTDQNNSQYVHNSCSEGQSNYSIWSHNFHFAARENGKQYIFANLQWVYKREYWLEMN